MHALLPEIKIIVQKTRCLQCVVQGCWSIRGINSWINEWFYWIRSSTVSIYAASKQIILPRTWVSLLSPSHFQETQRRGRRNGKRKARGAKCSTTNTDSFQTRPRKHVWTSSNPHSMFHCTVPCNKAKYFSPSFPRKTQLSCRFLSVLFIFVPSQNRKESLNHKHQVLHKELLSFLRVQRERTTLCWNISPSSNKN